VAAAGHCGSVIGGCWCLSWLQYYRCRRFGGVVVGLVNFLHAGSPEVGRLSDRAVYHTGTCSICHVDFSLA